MNKLTKTVCSALAVVGLIFGSGMREETPDTGNVKLDPSSMRLSKKGFEHIAKWEGCSLKAYQCSANAWTIFLGHTTGVKPGDVGTMEQAANAFVWDVSKAEKVVQSTVKSKVTQAQFDMMVSFTFNLGPTNFRQSTLLKRFNREDPDLLSCKEFLRWVFVNNKDCRKKENNCAGLPKRRDDEQSICFNGWG